MLFSDLASILSGKLHLHTDLELHHFSTDTRTLSGHPHEVFVATQGKRDGHTYLEEARQKGVKNFIVEKASPLPDCNSILVKSSIAALQQIAKHHRSKFQKPIIGITGSNGKTTVKEWLSLLLSNRFFVVKSPKSFNSQIGVPLSILEMQSMHELGVFEAGISQKNEMLPLQQIIRPTLGIFTTLGNAHSEGFASDEEKLAEKLKLFNTCEQLICRNDKPYFEQIAKTCKNLITWSTSAHSDYIVRWDQGQIRINEDTFSTHFFHDSDLENVTHAIIGALRMGVDREQIQKGLNLIKPIPMRLEQKQGINGSILLDDSYNNDLQGLKVAIEHLVGNTQTQKRTVILSDILQSGLSDPELYGRVNELLGKRKIDRLIGIGPRIAASKDCFDVESQFFETTEDLLKDMPTFSEEMIVIKGARDFGLERIVKRLEQRIHGTVLEVNFEALRHNLNQYRNLLAPTTKMMVMVKANAYGSGIQEVANFLQHQRVDRLGVAYIDEAIHLRKNGITIPIMIMNPDIDSFHEFEKYNLEAEIFSLTHFDRFLSSSSTCPIHLKIDTGMHRLGFSATDIPKLLNVLSANPSLQVQGIFTHFASSDDPQHDNFTLQQAQQFELIYQQLAAHLGYAPLKHACNSSGMVRWPQYHYDMVRLGIGLHGFDPTGTLSLRSTSQLKSAVSQVRLVQRGESIGYSRKGVVSRDSKIAILPIGYEDGFLRVFGNGRASVAFAGQLYPTIGNVCMDMLMVDVTGTEIKEGDEATIFGTSPTIEQLAEWGDTIPYEVLTNVSGRVKRKFIWD